MARTAKSALSIAEDIGTSGSDALRERIEALREEIAAISEAASEYAGNTLPDNARALATEVRRQASAAGQSMRDNPVPVVLALGVIVLLSAWAFARD